MYYGATRAAQVIQSHPNRDHLLRVLNQTTYEIMRGHEWGAQGDSSEGRFPSTGQQWPSLDGSGAQGQEQGGTTPVEPFDDDRLLSDEEVNRQSRGGRFPIPPPFILQSSIIIVFRGLFTGG